MFGWANWWDGSPLEHLVRPINGLPFRAEQRKIRPTTTYVNRLRHEDAQRRAHFASLPDQETAPGSWSKTPPLLLASREPGGAQLPISPEFGERHNCFSNKTADPQLNHPKTSSATPKQTNYG
jgi:hypothetical protein